MTTRRSTRPKRAVRGARVITEEGARRPMPGMRRAIGTSKSTTSAFRVHGLRGWFVDDEHVRMLTMLTDAQQDHRHGLVMALNGIFEPGFSPGRAGEYRAELADMDEREHYDSVIYPEIVRRELYARVYDDECGSKRDE
jgi:hypothetical protein